MVELDVAPILVRLRVLVLLSVFSIRTSAQQEDHMGGRGFLGTNASLLADITLVLSILVALILTLGAALAIAKRYTAHRWTQTLGVILNIVLVLAVMVDSFLESVLPGIPQHVGDAYYWVALLHGFIGLFAFIFGTFVMLRGNELTPEPLKFTNYKLYMRTAYGLYMLATALGIWVYVTWYAGSPQPVDSALVAQGDNEALIPMANFVFNPQEIVIPVGAKVIWVNQDSAPHTATADDGLLFDSQILGNGERFEFTFDQEGVFPYFCALHGAPGGIDMAGTIRVVPPDQAPPLPVAADVVAQPTAQPTAQPLPVAPLGQSAGTVAFRDNAAHSDQAVVNINLPAPPPSGQAYVAFLTTNDGSVAQNIGILQPAANGAARLEYTAPNGENLIAQFNRLVITQEPVGASPAAPTGPVAFAGSLPVQAYPHLVQLLANGAGLPTVQGYAVGLRVQTDELLRHAEFAVNAQAAGDLEGVKRHAEHMYNLIAGSLDPQFGDLNGDSRSQNPGDGFGLLPNGTQAGYLQAASDTALAAANAPDATDAIKIHAEHVRIAAENMRGWSAQASSLALQMVQTGDLASAQNQAAQLLQLSQQIQGGIDINGDGAIAPVPGEGGGLTAYEHAQYIGGFGLFPAQP
jgi:plastocyanin